MKTFRYRRFKPYQNVLGVGACLAVAGWIVAQGTSPGFAVVPLAVVGYAAWRIQRDAAVLIEIDGHTLTFRDGSRTVALSSEDGARLESARSEPGVDTDVFLVSEKGRVPINTRFENYADLFREVNRLWPDLPNLLTVHL